MRVWLVAVEAVLLFLLSATAFGQSSAQQAPVREENLSGKIISPIVFLMKFTLENKYSPSVWYSRGEENEVEGQFFIPFEAFTRQNLARIKIFFETSSPDGTHGLSEAEAFDLMLFPRSWGTFGFGVTTHMTAETSSSLGAVAPGPAVGAVVKH